MADPGNTNVYAGNLFDSFRILVLSADFARVVSLMSPF